MHIRPPPPPPIPPIPWAALCSWLTAFPGHFMLDERHATADTRHRSSIGGSLFQRAMSLGWWQWPQWSQVNQLAGQQRVSERHISNPASQSILNSQTNFFLFFLYESYLWYWKRHIHNVRLKIYLLLIVRGDILLKMKPFEATRRNLMSALCGSVCVLAYYLLIIEFVWWRFFFYTTIVIVKSTPIKENNCQVRICLRSCLFFLHSTRPDSH